MEIGHTKLLLILSDISFYVNLFGASTNFPESLVLIRSASAEDFTGLLSRSPSQPTAYICPSELPMSQSLFAMLENKLQTDIEDTSSSMLEFQDPLDFTSVYLLAHSDDLLGLGPFIRCHSLGMFKFSITSFFDRNSIDYIKNVKSLNYSLFKEYQSVTAQLTRAKQDLQIHLNLLEYEKNMNREFRKEMNFTNKTLQYLSNKQKEMKIMCEYCQTVRKNMLMIPCYHIIGCSDCVAQKLALDEHGTPTNHFKCIYCHAPVQSCKEVLFS